MLVIFKTLLNTTTPDFGILRARQDLRQKKCINLNAGDFSLLSQLTCFDIRIDALMNISGVKNFNLPKLRKE